MADTISGFGTTLSGATTGAVTNVRSIDGPDIEVDDIDVTSMSNTGGWKQFVPGLRDAGELSLTITYDKTLWETVHARVGNAVEVWTLTWPDTSTFVVSGYIKGVQMAAPYDDAMEGSLTIKLTNNGVFTPA